MVDPFVHGPRGAYHMEARLVDSLDEVTANATNERLSDGFADRLDLDDEVTRPLRDNLESEEATFRQLQTLSGASDLESLWEKLTP